MSGWQELGAGQTIPNPAPELTEAEQQRQAEISDSDGDGVPNATDNCNTKANPGQEDADADGIGDACQQANAEPPANTGAPTIAGIARDGQTLTADRGTWTGTPPIDHTYAWMSCDGAGNSCQAVGSDDSFDLTAAQVGRRMKVRVTAANGGGEASATSALTGAVAAAAPAAGSAPAISGDARDGAVLHADAGTWTGTAPIAFAYQWLRCDAAGGACAAIAGEAAQDHTAGAADIGRRLRVRVTASNAGGGAMAESAATAAVAAVALASVSAPVVSGTAEVGRVLTTSTGTWTGSDPKAFAHAWLRCDTAGASCAPIGGATGDSYTLGAADEGRSIRSRVTATNPAGALARDSAATGRIAAAQANGGGGPFGPLNPLQPGGPGNAGAATDTTPPAVTVTVKRTRIAALRRAGLSIAVRCSEACAIAAKLVRRPAGKSSATLSMTTTGSAPARAVDAPRRPRGSRAAAKPRPQVIARATGRLDAAGTKTVVLRLTGKARRTVKPLRRLAATLQLTVRDPSGNATSVSRPVSVRR
jgi:hypothetical protein